MEVSVRELEADLDTPAVDRCHRGTGRKQLPRHRASRRPQNRRGSRSMGKQIHVDGDGKSLYARIDTESKLLVKVDVFSRHGTDLAAVTRARLSCGPSERKGL
jgi:hypothetical protein